MMPAGIGIKIAVSYGGSGMEVGGPVLRAAMLLFPLAMMPMVWHVMAERLWEFKLRSEIRRSLQLRQVLGGDGPVTVPLDTVTTGPFLLIEREQDSLLMIKAIGPTTAERPRFSLSGCLEQGSGLIEVQARFSDPEPALCSDIP